MPVSQQTTLGAEFAQAYADKDSGRMRELLHPEVDFRALTPKRVWEARDSDGVLEILFGNWLEDTDEVEALEDVQHGTVADRERVGYLLSVNNPEGRFVVEQQAYLSAREGRIDWMRVVCSGFRPATTP
jgi:hypothetical protein